MAETISTQLAKECAKVMHATASAAGTPPAVELEAAFLLMRGLFGAHVKPEKRLQMFDSATAKLREHIQSDMKRKKNGKASH